MDLNVDGGEVPEWLANGREERLYRLVTRVSIACGGHAGDEGTMRQALGLARQAGILVGAHPSYPDRARFGRVEMALPVEQVTGFVRAQIESLSRIADELGLRLSHVKPHGALYNQLAGDEALARAFARGVDPSLQLVGLAGSRAIGVWRAMGFGVLEEAFLDRAYRADGRLVPRTEPGALIEDPALAVAQAGVLLSRGCDTFCVHGDNPGAERILNAIRSRWSGRKP